MDYSKSKDLIRQTNLLNNEDIDYIDQNIGEIQENWEKRQIYRTEIEMRISVLNDLKFTTPAAKYWQCVREQSVFYEQLVSQSFEYRRLKLKKAKLEEKLSRAEGFKKEKLQIDYEELQFSMLSVEKSANDRMREIRLWSQLMQEQVDADPTFDRADVGAHQLESYTKRFKNQITNMGANAPPGERQNMLGQLATAERVAKEQNAGLGNVTQMRIRFEDMDAVPRK